MKFDRRLTDEIYTSDTVRLGKMRFRPCGRRFIIMVVFRFAVHRAR